jgi:trehalose-phosphatase
MKKLPDLIPPGAPVAVFLDYDGTLVPIRGRPELARLTVERRDELALLGKELFVGIVSGRPLAQLRRMVGLPGLVYVGNHGLEIWASGRTWVHPEAARAKRKIARAVSAIKSGACDFPGIFVENKGLTASVHFRQVPARHHAPLRAIVADEVRRSRGDLVLSRGKKVFEIRPNIPWDKGRGVLELLRRPRGLRAFFPVYIGDDQTDEDAFRALRDRGMTIRVGPGRKTLAGHRLPGVDDVWKFLAALRTRPVPEPLSREGRGPRQTRSSLTSRRNFI